MIDMEGNHGGHKYYEPIIHSISQVVLFFTGKYGSLVTFFFKDVLKRRKKDILQLYLCIN